MPSLAVMMGAIFLAVALISLLPVAWAPWVFFGVVGTILIIIYGFFKR